MQKKLQSDGGFPRQLKIKMLPISIKPSICKYYLYSSLRTHLNFNGDISLTFKRTLQVPQINVLFIHYKIAYAMFLLQIIQLKGNMEIL